MRMAKGKTAAQHIPSTTAAEAGHGTIQIAAKAKKAHPISRAKYGQLDQKPAPYFTRDS